MKSPESKDGGACSQVTGVILAGGKSRRMGLDKATLKIGNKLLIDFPLKTLSHIFTEILIVTSATQILTLKPFLKDRDGIRLVTDLIPDHGALGGIYTALNYSRTPYVFVCACDMPFLNPLFIQYMVNLTNNYDVIIPKSSKMLETLHAIYKKTCLEVIKQFLSQDRNKIIEFFPAVSVYKVLEGFIRAYDENEKMFQNLNTPEELKGALF